MLTLEEAIRIVESEFPKTDDFKSCRGLDEVSICAVDEYDNAFIFLYAEPSWFDEEVHKRVKEGLPGGFWCPPLPIVDRSNGNLTVAYWPYLDAFPFKGERRHRTINANTKKPTSIDDFKRIAADKDGVSFKSPLGMLAVYEKGGKWFVDDLGRAPDPVVGEYDSLDRLLADFKRDGKSIADVLDKVDVLVE